MEKIKEYKPVGLSFLNKKRSQPGSGHVVLRAKKRANHVEKIYFTGEIPIKPMRDGYCFICDKKITFKKGNPKRVCAKHTYRKNKNQPCVLRHTFTPDGKM